MVSSPFLHPTHISSVHPCRPALSMLLCYAHIMLSKRAAMLQPSRSDRSDFLSFFLRWGEFKKMKQLLMVFQSLYFSYCSVSMPIYICSEWFCFPVSLYSFQSCMHAAASLLNEEEAPVKNFVQVSTNKRANKKKEMEVSCHGMLEYSEMRRLLFFFNWRPETFWASCSRSGFFSVWTEAVGFVIPRRMPSSPEINFSSCHVKIVAYAECHGQLYPAAICRKYAPDNWSESLQIKWTKDWCLQCPNQHVSNATQEDG